LSIFEMNLMTSRIRATPTEIMASPAQTEGRTLSRPASSRCAAGSATVVTPLRNAVSVEAMMPPSEPVATPADELPTHSRMPKVQSRGKKMATDNRLYMSWTDAAEKAVRNWLRSPAAPSDTRVEVIVVPTLAPIRIGTAVARGRPPATIPTTIEVVVEED